MTRHLLEQSLAECEERLARSEELIQRQRQVATDLEGDGSTDAIQMAHALLELFERSRDRHQAERDRYLKLLERSMPPQQSGLATLSDEKDES
jgi:hypothetical protein